jgi:lysophospholipase L1-like esterase
MKYLIKTIGFTSLAVIIIVLAISCGSNKQEVKLEVLPAKPPFWNEIQSFKKQDSFSFPQDSAILFIGSSSFTMWQDVQDYFPGYTIINRGFGGSTLLDQIRYANDIIFPYNPKQIVIYCGENDLASSDTVTAQMVFERFKQLYGMIREKSKAPVAYISMKPSPSRRHLIKKMLDADLQIVAFLFQENLLILKKNYNVLIDVHSKMLNAAGEPIPEIFLNDSLHMNAKGYAIWQKIIEPYLLK